MKPIHLYIGVLAISLIGAGVAVASPPLPAIDQTSSADHQAIEALLASYTRCVTEHDEAGFRALLLDEKIPFAAVAASTTSDSPPDLRRYEDFRQAVFVSGQRYQEKFYNVRIEQHGPLAQVSLNFLTERVPANEKPAPGWKVLQLVKVGGHWKIASALYTF